MNASGCILPCFLLNDPLVELNLWYSSLKMHNCAGLRLEVSKAFAAGLVLREGNIFAFVGHVLLWVLWGCSPSASLHCSPTPGVSLVHALLQDVPCCCSAALLGRCIHAWEGLAARGMI